MAQKYEVKQMQQSQQSKPNPFENALEQLRIAAEYLKLDDGIHKNLASPKRQLTVSVPVKMDSGEMRVFTGHRVQYNDARCPFKGGIRNHPGVTIDEVKAFAAWMTWKTSVANIPLGGGKGGIVCDPKHMSQGELERMTRRYAAGIAPIIGPYKDIPAPDVYTNGQTMAWILDTFSTLEGVWTPGVITGKPVPLGGSLGRDKATGRGAVFCTVEAAKVNKIDLKKATFAVPGFGYAGSFYAQILQTYGSKLMAASDSKGAITSKAPMDADKLIAHKEKPGSVVGFPGSQPISDKELLQSDVDILSPAALENSILPDTAKGVKAKVIVECANGPTTPEADKILHANKVFMIPDILANSGGVIVSYLEWVQNLERISWSETEVNDKLERQITAAFKDSHDASAKHGVDMRTGAMIVGVGRVAEAVKTRGVFP